MLAVVAGEAKTPMRGPLCRKGEGELDRREIRQTRKSLALYHRERFAPNPSTEMALKRRCANLPQFRRAFLYDAAIDLRHARGGRAFARAKREGVHVSEAAFVNN